MVFLGDVCKDVGNRLDQEVAARVAEGVVHLLEAVDIDEEDGVHASRMQAIGDEVRQGAAIADARELVDRADRVQFLDVVAVAHHDGGDAQDGVQRLGDGREAVFGRIDDGDVAERAVLNRELADGVALALRLVDGLDLGVALLIGCGIVDEQDGTAVECVVERFVLENSDVLQALAQRCGVIWMPFVRTAQMEAVGLLFHQDDMRGLERAPELFHHAQDADIRVFFLYGEARDVIDGDVISRCQSAICVDGKHVLDIKAVGEDTAAILPGDQRVPDEVVLAGAHGVELAEMEAVTAQLVLRAGAARRG